jgi:ssDNA-binding Zn-finger/Zn-ribbon topoisomerase 1
MPLTTCPDCDEQVSINAAACPRCGKPSQQTVAQNKLKREMLGLGGKGCSGCFMLVGGLILVLAALILYVTVQR